MADDVKNGADRAYRRQWRTARMKRSAQLARERDTRQREELRSADDVPIDLRGDVERIAEECGRDVSWVIRRALRLYVRAGEGVAILATASGREEIARGELHDFDDVLDELEHIVHGPKH